MFLNKYVNDFYYNLIINNYEEDYLNSLDEIKFLYNYKIFKKYGFYFIDDIIVNYLEIFDMEFEDVLIGIEKLKRKLGSNYIKIIGKDMKHLKEIINEKMKEINLHFCFDNF